MSQKVLIVGTGITAAVTAALLRRKAKDSLRLVIWDKAKGSGGRMCTSRSPGDPDCYADLGAQYITTLPDNFEKNRDVYSVLTTAGVLEPLATSSVMGLKTNFPIGTQHFVAPHGMGSVVKHFLNQGSPEEISFQHHVKSISNIGDKIKVQTQAGKSEEFDIVVLTLPVPQLLELSGTISTVISNQPELNASLNAVKYSTRFALALYFSGGDGQQEPWAASYIDNHSIFRYVAFDHRKRNQPEKPPAAIFHTSITYGAENEKKSLTEMEPLLKSEYQKLFPTWPKPAALKCHKWRYSQVLEPVPNKPGYAVILQQPLIIAGGDSFIGSGFDNCLFSAQNLTDQVLLKLK